MGRFKTEPTKETIVGKLSCTLCGTMGTLPILDLNPPRVTGDALCPCAVQLLWDGRTLWVNGGDGSSIARFSLAGIDIHADSDAQIGGAHQCLQCEPATEDDMRLGKVGKEHRLWPVFERALRHHYSIAIPDGFMEQGEGDAAAEP